MIASNYSLRRNKAPRRGTLVTHKGGRSVYHSQISRPSSSMGCQKPSGKNSKRSNEKPTKVRFTQWEKYHFGFIQCNRHSFSDPFVFSIFIDHLPTNGLRDSRRVCKGRNRRRHILGSWQRFLPCPQAESFQCHHSSEIFQEENKVSVLPEAAKHLRFQND